MPTKLRVYELNDIINEARVAVRNPDGSCSDREGYTIVFHREYTEDLRQTFYLFPKLAHKFDFLEVQEKMEPGWEFEEPKKIAVLICKAMVEWILDTEVILTDA